MNTIKDEDLVKEQMKTISKLQDTINLLKFDITQLNKEKREVSDKLSRREENIKKARTELSRMKRKNDFSKIDNIFYMLRVGFDNE